ncbi:hypothetical protein L7F22_063818 [Adiantum nelumboides]|nr:hypothetical protein [Adiantum nelumboides]
MTTGKNGKGEQTGHQKYYMKLAKRYYEPFQNLFRINETAYKLRLPANWYIHNAFHVSLLKPFKGDPPKEPVQEEPPLFDDIEEVLQQEEILRHEENILRSGKFKDGDWVLLRFTKARLNMTTGKNGKGEQTGHQKYYMKLAKRYYEPFQNLFRINETAYKLRLPANWYIHNAFHVSLLKPFKGDPPKEPVQEEPPLFDDIEEVLQQEEILRHEENILRSGKSCCYGPDNAYGFDEGDFGYIIDCDSIGDRCCSMCSATSAAVIYMKTFHKFKRRYGHWYGRGYGQQERRRQRLVGSAATGAELEGGCTSGTGEGLVCKGRGWQELKRPIRAAFVYRRRLHDRKKAGLKKLKGRLQKGLQEPAWADLRETTEGDLRIIKGLSIKPYVDREWMIRRGRLVIGRLAILAFP